MPHSFTSFALYMTRFFTRRFFRISFFHNESLTDAESKSGHSFANGILKRRMPLVTVSLFILVSETITESRISATKFLTRLETRLDSLRHGLVPVNCYFYRERWLLFHRANHQKLAQFIIRIAWWGRLLFARPPLGQKSAETLHTFPSLRFPNFFSRPLLIAPLLHERIRTKTELFDFRDEKLIQEIG